MDTAPNLFLAISDRLADGDTRITSAYGRLVNRNQIAGEMECLR